MMSKQAKYTHMLGSIINVKDLRCFLRSYLLLNNCRARDIECSDIMDMNKMTHYSQSVQSKLDIVSYLLLLTIFIDNKKDLK